MESRWLTRIRVTGSKWRKLYSPLNQGKMTKGYLHQRVRLRTRKNRDLLCLQDSILTMRKRSLMMSLPTTCQFWKSITQCRETTCMLAIKQLSKTQFPLLCSNNRLLSRESLWNKHLKHWQLPAARSLKSNVFRVRDNSLLWNWKMKSKTLSLQKLPMHLYQQLQRATMSTYLARRF